MSLFKKTIVLSNNGVKGYLTVVRVGDSAGLKLVLAEPPTDATFFAVKVQDAPLLVKKITEQTTEMSANILPDERTPIGAMLVIAGKAVAYGGKKELVNFSEVATHMSPKPMDFARMTTTEVIKEEPPARHAFEPVFEPSAEVAFSEPVQVSKPSPSPIEATSASSKTHMNFDFLKTARPDYFTGVHERVEELLRVYPSCAELNEVVPDSEWVLIHYDKEDYYVFGVLREGGRVTHIGYGLPGFQSTNPPAEIAGIADFAPLKNPTQRAQGYWLMFQNAEDGKLIK